MDNEQITKDFRKNPSDVMSAEEKPETLSYLLKYTSRKNTFAFFFTFLLLLMIEAAIMFFISEFADTKILIYIFIGSAVLAVLFMLFMIYGAYKSNKKQVEKLRSSPPSNFVFELYLDDLVIKLFKNSELKFLYTAEKGVLEFCDQTKDIFIFKNNGLYFAIENEVLSQHPDIKKFIIDTAAKKGKKISA